MRSLRPLLRPASLLVAVLLPTACGGGSHGSLPAPGGGASSALANAKFAFTIPAPSTAAASGRKPLYIPASTRSIQLTVTASTNATFSGPLSGTLNVAPGTSGTNFSCTAVAAGNYTCTTTFPLPPGTDTLSIAGFDAINAGGNLLSRQVVTKTVVAGANDFTGTPITLDAAPGTLSVVGLSGPTGTYPSFSVTGTAPVTFTVSVVDAHGTAFAGQPGLPTITHAAATGTGASAVVSGATLTLTPPSVGASTSVVVAADPLGAQDVTTTLASSPAAGATSFTVTSASGIVAGDNLVLDYETFSGTTLLQESALVTNVSGTTITVSAGLAHAHTAGAGVRHYADNLTPSTALFTVAITSPLFIVPVATDGFESTPSKALVYNSSLALQTGTLTSPSIEFAYGRFDSSGRLYVADENADFIYRSQYTAGTGFGALTQLTGIPIQGAIFGFDVSANGTVAVENSAGITPQLDYYAPNATTPATFSSSLASGTWQTATDYYFPSVAVLTDGTGSAFGYAYDVFNVAASAHDQIVVTSGSGEQDINIPSIISTFSNDVGAPVLAWDQGRQSLIYGNSEATSSFAILEFPRNGTTGAVLQTTPATVGTVSGYPQAVAVSRDGAYVAVAWNNGGGTNVSIFHNNGSAWALVSAGSALTTANFANFTSVHFLSNGNLIVSDSDGTSYAHLAQYTNAGVLVGSVYNAATDFGTGYLINDVAVSY